MVVAVYGGSFNPPHVGHAMVASWLLWTRRVDAVYLVPCFDHAFDKALAPFERRVAMCEAAAAEIDPRISISRIESELPTPSYTIHTLRALATREPDKRFRLVLGSDNQDQTHLWRDWPTIAAEFAPIWVGRDGYPTLPDAPTFPGISSTEIRDRLGRGESVEHLVPAASLALLGDLYRSPSGA